DGANDHLVPGDDGCHGRLYRAAFRWAQRKEVRERTVGGRADKFEDPTAAKDSTEPTHVVAHVVENDEQSRTAPVGAMSQNVARYAASLVRKRSSTSRRQGWAAASLPGYFAPPRLCHGRLQQLLRGLARHHVFHGTDDNCQYSAADPASDQLPNHGAGVEATSGAAG